MTKKTTKRTRTKQPAAANRPKTGLLIAAIVVVVLLGALIYFLSADKTVEVEALTDVNLRKSPGATYATVGNLAAGSTATAVGRNEDGSWLQVKMASGELAWITSNTQFVKISGDALALPVVTAPSPASAYDANNVKVKELLNQIPLVVLHGDRQTCASHGGLNNLLPEVVAGNVIGPHSGDFVWKDKGNVLFKYTGGAFQLIRENPVARFDNDAAYLSFERALAMFASGDIIWNGKFGDKPARGVTGCDPAVK
jgi:uncharacterized protein YraI